MRTSFGERLDELIAKKANQKAFIGLAEDAFVFSVSKPEPANWDISIAQFVKNDRVVMKLEQNGMLSARDVMQSSRAKIRGIPYFGDKMFADLHKSFLDKFTSECLCFLVDDADVMSQFVNRGLLTVPCLQQHRAKLDLPPVAMFQALYICTFLTSCPVQGTAHKIAVNEVEFKRFEKLCDTFLESQEKTSLIEVPGIGPRVISSIKVYPFENGHVCAFGFTTQGEPVDVALIAKEHPSD